MRKFSQNKYNTSGAAICSREIFSVVRKLYLIILDKSHENCYFEKEERNMTNSIHLVILNCTTAYFNLILT